VHDRPATARQSGLDEEEADDMFTAALLARAKALLALASIA
jgi:hypothetical protein